MTCILVYIVLDKSVRIPVNKAGELVLLQPKFPETLENSLVKLGVTSLSSQSVSVNKNKVTSVQVGSSEPVETRFDLAFVEPSSDNLIIKGQSVKLQKLLPAKSKKWLTLGGAVAISAAALVGGGLLYRGRNKNTGGVAPATGTEQKDTSDSACQKLLNMAGLTSKIEDLDDHKREILSVMITDRTKQDIFACAAEVSDMYNKNDEKVIDCVLKILTSVLSEKQKNQFLEYVKTNDKNLLEAKYIIWMKFSTLSKIYKNFPDEWEDMKSTQLDSENVTDSLNEINVAQKIEMGPYFTLAKILKDKKSLELNKVIETLFDLIYNDFDKYTYVNNIKEPGDQLDAIITVLKRPKFKIDNISLTKDGNVTCESLGKMIQTKKNIQCIVEKENLMNCCYVLCKPPKVLSLTHTVNTIPILYLSY